MIITIPRANRSPLTIPIADTPIPQGLTRVTLQIDRFAFPLSLGQPVGSIAIEISIDDGATWYPEGFVLTGGTFPAPKEGPNNKSFKTFTLPNPELSTRRIRGAPGIVTTQTLDFGGKIEIL